MIPQVSKSSAEIGNDIAELEKQLTEALESQHQVEQAILLLQRDILDKQRAKKDLEIANSKATHLVRKLTIETRLLRGAFWSCKNQGL